MEIKITGISLPFGGLSWEITDEEKLISTYLGILSSKRLLSLPWDRPHLKMPWRQDAQYCIESALHIKHLTEHVLLSHDLSSSTINIMGNICLHCNTFLETASEAINEENILSCIYITDDKIPETSRQEFVEAVKLLKESIEREISPLIDRLNKSSTSYDFWNRIKKGMRGS